MASGSRTVDKLKFFPAATITNLTSVAGLSGAWVSMKGYNNLTIVLTTTNTAAPTASVVTVAQGKWVNGNATKACQLDYVWTAQDIANNGVALTQTAVTSNTFNTFNTANSYHLNILEVRADRMDTANSFTALQVNMVQAVNQVASITYIMGNVPRYSGGYNSFCNPLVD